MKILYAIQGTGNGHSSRAREIIPFLNTLGNLDLLISGEQSELQMPIPVKYRLKGMGFFFGKNGGVDVVKTLRRADFIQFFKDVKNLPVEDYDIILNDFEPVSAWACKMKKKAIIGLSHQSAVSNPLSPKPSGFYPVGKFLLNTYAPVSKAYGFHYEEYANNIYSPLIRSEVRNFTPTNQGHHTVYLPAYSDKKLIQLFEQFPEFNWQVFSKHSDKAYRHKNIWIRPVQNEAYLESLASCAGLFCGAGFEAPSEALFLGKKLMVLPMHNQYEQVCNAHALEQMGVGVIKTLLHPSAVGGIRNWLNNAQAIHKNYPSHTEEIIKKIVETEMGINLQKPVLEEMM